MGINAEVKHINPTNNSCEEIITEKDYIDSIEWSLDGINEEEKNKAKEFYKKCISNNQNPPLRDNRWVLISWKK